MQSYKDALRQTVRQHHPADKPVHICCKALSPQEAIGTPEHDDDPIVKGKEVPVEAVFDGGDDHSDGGGEPFPRPSSRSSHRYAAGFSKIRTVDSPSTTVSPF
jgi:hypothetical protein